MTKTLDNAIGYNFTNRYYANEFGEVFFNTDTGRGAAKRKKDDRVKSFINMYGYVEYNLTDINGDRKHIQAHRIVATLFIPLVEGKKYVNHIDGNKENNHISNLEWCTAQENELHSVNVLGKAAWNIGKEMPSGEEYRGVIRTVYRFSLNGEFEKEYFNPIAARRYMF
jgi:hypothetical protein